MYRALLIDVDGVVKKGGELIPRVPQAVRLLRSKRVGFLLVTNNSTKSPEKLSEELRAAGLNVHPREIMTSAQALLQILKTRASLALRAKEGIYVVGEQGVLQELAKGGYKITDRETGGIVVVGLDREFNYQKLTIAARSLMMGAAYLATNTDRTYPTENGLMPGAGSIAAAISAAANRRPLNVGKPSKLFFQLAISRLGGGLDRREVLVVGDRPETDIRMANAVGCDSALVLSGVTWSTGNLKGKNRPTYVFRDLYELVQKVFGE